MNISANIGDGAQGVVVGANINTAKAAKTCATCCYLQPGCSIFAVAREQQIQHVRPEDFGCAWHTTPKQYNKAVEARFGKPDREM